MCTNCNITGLFSAACCCLQVSPHTLIVWRPDLHTYTAHLTHSLNSTAGAAHAKMNNANLPKVVGQGLGKAIQLWQEDVHVSEVSSCGAQRWGHVHVEG
jgi:hypothetical protein